MLILLSQSLNIPPDLIGLVSSLGGGGGGAILFSISKDGGGVILQPIAAARISAIKSPRSTLPQY